MTTQIFMMITSTLLQASGTGTEPFQEVRVNWPRRTNPGDKLSVISVRIIGIGVHKYTAGKTHSEIVKILACPKCGTYEQGPRLITSQPKSVPVCRGVNVLTSNIAVGCGPVIRNVKISDKTGRAQRVTNQLACRKICRCVTKLYVSITLSDRTLLYVLLGIHALCVHVTLGQTLPAQNRPACSILRAYMLV